jgi:uncharacterized lipoprotein YddW (UPF0748 family)
LKTAGATYGAIAAAPGAGPAASGGVIPELGSAPPLYLADLDRCEPKSALARKPTHGRWHLLECETEHSRGFMLVVGHNTAAPDITYPLERKGWHAISIGLRALYGDSQLMVRLKSDTTFTLLTRREDRSARDRVDDLFWKAADLTGEHIVLRQPRTQTVPENAASLGNVCSPAWVAYIKLVPLSEDEVRALVDERGRKETRRLFAHNDAWSDHTRFRPVSAADIRHRVEAYRDTDFSRLYWEASQGDRCNYFTKIGLMPSDDWISDPHRLADRLAAESWRILRKKGIDPFRVALEHTHAIGLEFHASVRMAGFHFPTPETEWNTGGVYDKHPEWRGTDRNGRATPRLSYAHPGFREFVLSLLKEVAGYPVDGICLLYNRRPPVVEYEAPVVDAFKAKYGKDPRKLDPKDPQWLAHRAEVLTSFMRDVRAAMDAIAQQQKRKRIEVSAIVMSTEAENLYNAMDLPAWINNGSVDTIIPYTSVPNVDSNADSFEDPQAAEFFLRITRGTSCKAAFNFMPRQLSPETYRMRAHRLYEAGAEHFFFWDCNGRHDYSPAWSALRRLGHREEIAAWARGGALRLPRPGSQLRRLGDWDLSYVTPG